MKIERATVFHENDRTEITLKDITHCHALPCALDGLYYINGVYLDTDDFGESYDEGGYCGDEDVVAYGCVNRVFETYLDESHLVEAMRKYNITQREYLDIQDKLESLLYVGECGWCI